MYFPNTDGESKYTDNAKYSNQMVCIFSSIITCASNDIEIIFVWKISYISNRLMNCAHKTVQLNFIVSIEELYVLS